MTQPTRQRIAIKFFLSEPHLVSIKNVDNGEKLYCPQCNSGMFLTPIAEATEDGTFIGNDITCARCGKISSIKELKPPTSKKESTFKKFSKYLGLGNYKYFRELS